jgi:hypothetical protein
MKEGKRLKALESEIGPRREIEVKWMSLRKEYGVLVFEQERSRVLMNE